ncbi:MAG: hypothetical protein H6R33_931 [Actinobacteria bacterium]|nr:hypothetical protein [Acidobacteriota bacterium]MBS1196211.1 hypothetical protein [Actinomycetota bacterium]
MDLLRTGFVTLAGGARRGNPGMAGLGAAMLIVGWLRRRRAPRRSLLYARTLRPGESLRVHALRRDEDPETGR